MSPTKRNFLIFDLETYYDKDYSLRKMPTPNYILDQRFELQIAAVRLNNEPLHRIVQGPDFPAFLASLDPKITTTVSFNSLFDNSILSYRYGWVPDLMLDVMGMARALIGHELKHGVSLKAIADHFNLPAKGTALANVMGMRRDEIIGRGLMKDFEDYAIRDNEICEAALKILYPGFPPAERRLMDMTLRCAVEPRFLCDTKMLNAHLVDVQDAKAQLLRDANNIDPKLLMSTDRFRDELERCGVDVEEKISPTGALVPAFAKTDEFMEKLQADVDPYVSALATARLGLKSTLEETRTMKFISVAGCNWGASRLDWTGASFMPIPLRYGGAHTHRLSGEWKMNPQNMPTVRGSKGKSKLRQSLVVCDDETVVTCDLSQIEARIAAWISGCTTLVQEFRDKKDPYSQLATDIFGYPVNRKLKHPNGELIFPIEGFIGKTGILGLGYGAGKDKFDGMVIMSARKDGLDISKIYNRALGDKAVTTYRRRYHQMPRAWNILNGHIGAFWLTPSGGQVKFGPCIIKYGEVVLPSGLSLLYADPGQRFDPETNRTEYRYRYGKTWHRLYGAKLLENIVQALARIVVMNAALRIRARGLSTANPEDYRFRLQAHDELVFIVKKTGVDLAKKIILEEMKRPPTWGPDIPLDAELGEGSSYGAAK